MADEDAGVEREVEEGRKIRRYGCDGEDVGLSVDDCGARDDARRAQPFERIVLTLERLILLVRERACFAMRVARENRDYSFVERKRWSGDALHECVD